MIEERIEVGEGGTITVQEHHQRPSVVLEMPSGDGVEMSPEEARKVVAAMIRACVAIESSPDYEPCAFSDVPDVRGKEFAAAGTIHAGDAVVARDNTTVVAVPWYPRAMLDGASVKVVAEPHRDIAVAFARAIADATGADINTILVPR